MKDFEEQFPELDKKCIKLSGGFGINGLFIHPNYNAPASTLYLFTLEDIEKYCLDKNKVREVIKLIEKHESRLKITNKLEDKGVESYKAGLITAISILKKELGL